MKRAGAVVLVLLLALGVVMFALAGDAAPPPRVDEPSRDGTVNAAAIAHEPDAVGPGPKARSARESAQFEVEVMTRNRRRPVADARVQLAGESSAVVTDATGHARVARSGAAQRLAVTAAGFAPADAAVPALGEDQLTILLSRLTEVSGTVTDETSRPLAGCRIDVVADANREWTTTDARGAFCLDGLPGRFCVSLTPAPGSGVWRAPGTATLQAGEHDTLIVLERETSAWAQAHVVAFDASTGMQLPIARCDLERAEPGGSVFLESPECLIDSSTAVIDAVAGGRWRFDVALDDGRLAGTEADLRSGQRQEVRIEVRPTVTLRGTIRDAAGKVCNVMLEPPSGHDAHHANAFGDGFAQCAEDGTYELVGVSARPCLIRVDAGNNIGLASWNGADQGAVTIDITCHAKVTVEFALGDGVALDGILLLSTPDGSWHDVAITSPAGAERQHLRCWVPAGPLAWEYRFYRREADGRAVAASRRGTCVAGTDGVQTIAW